MLLIQQNNLSRQKINSIDGLRGIGVLIILYQHILAIKITQKLNFYWLLDQGWIGVNLFFILSGFVLYKPYILGQKKIKSKIDFYSFYKNRFLRIYPLFFFIIIISFLFIHPIDIEAVKNLFLTLSCTSIFTFDYFYPLHNMAFWTLEIEIIFSLIFPFLVIIINRFGLKKTALFIFSSSLSIRVFGSYTSFIFDYANPIKDCIFARLDDFLLGMIICYIYFKKSNILKKIEDKKVLKILIPICIITACLIVDLKQNKQLEYIFLMAFINNLLQIAFGLLIISCLIRKDKFIVMFFENYFLRLIGVMCYSLYSWNMLIIGKINWGIMYDIPDFFLTLMIIFLLSAFTFRFIEFREENNLKKLFLINTDG